MRRNGICWGEGEGGAGNRGRTSRDVLGGLLSRRMVQVEVIASREIISGARVERAPTMVWA